MSEAQVDIAMMDLDSTLAADEYGPAKASKFRFKPKRDRDVFTGQQPDGEARGHRRRHKHHHISKRRRVEHGEPTDPSTFDDTYLPNPSSSKFISPEDAFRESLFDAMADDEGAAFWEGVYGQPLHTYSNVREGPEGELERMTDEEYTSYVRGKMWEKSHQHIIEERERREQESSKRRSLKEEERRMRQDRTDFEKAMEDSLRRGSERKRRKKWADLWDRYLKNWEELKPWASQQGNMQEETRGKLKEKIFWPVESGKLDQVRSDEVENFMRHAPASDDSGKDVNKELLDVLKMERVRWHPDKIQQRFGGIGVDDETMKAVTAVFQVIDRMWSDLRTQS